MPAKVTIQAFAKINLGLRITGRQPDGFHDLQTIFQALDLSDRLICRARRGPFEISCRAVSEQAAEKIPCDRTNLVWRAAELLWSAAGREGEPRDTHVLLEKAIPTRAGLGGGSSDGAAALLALRRLWKLRVSDVELRTMAATLGSDVSFFLVGGTALGLGRGEQVYPLADLPPWWAVLAFPPFGIATADAFAWFDEDTAKTQAPPAVPVRYLPDTWLGRFIPLVNDLEIPVIRRHPAIGALRDRLGSMGALTAGMSGSGSTVFGIFKTPGPARKAARALRRSGANAVCVRMMDRKQIRRFQGSKVLGC